MSTPRAPRTRTSSVAKASRAGEGSKNVWLIVAVVAVVAFAAVIAVALSQEDSGGGGDETAEVEVTGGPLPFYESGSPDEGIGMAAPALAGTTVEGDSLTIDPADGEPKLIAFLAHWCPHCQAEVPRVVEWMEAGNAPDDVALYAVSTSITPGRDNYPPSDWFDEEDWTVPTLKDDAGSPAHLSYGAGGFPYWVALDADGEVVARTSGETTIAQLEAMIDQARTGGA